MQIKTGLSAILSGFDTARKKDCWIWGCSESDNANEFL
jgi:hypothetical protein